MSLVVDASVAIKWFVAEDLSEQGTLFEPLIRYLGDADFPEGAGEGR